MGGSRTRDGRDCTRIKGTSPSQGIADRSLRPCGFFGSRRNRFAKMQLESNHPPSLAVRVRLLGPPMVNTRWVSKEGEFSRASWLECPDRFPVLCDVPIRTFKFLVSD